MSSMKDFVLNRIHLIPTNAKVTKVECSQIRDAGIGIRHFVDVYYDSDPGININKSVDGLHIRSIDCNRIRFTEAS